MHHVNEAPGLHMLLALKRHREVVVKSLKEGVSAKHAIFTES